MGPGVAESADSYRWMLASASRQIWRGQHFPEPGFRRRVVIGIRMADSATAKMENVLETDFAKQAGEKPAKEWRAGEDSNPRPPDS